MKNLLVGLALIGLVAGGLSAQSCSDLTVSGNLTSGGDITFDVTGAPAEAPTFVLVSLDTGPTTIGPITLGIGLPIIVCAGSTDVNGDFSCTLNIPNVPPSVMLDPIDLNSQAITVDLTSIDPGPPPSIGFCLSDVEAFTLTL